MAYMPGEHVVWLYRPRGQPRNVQFVDAEIVYTGQIKTRIRVGTAAGKPLLRWVNPRNLRPKPPDEPEYPYPE